MSNVGTGEQLTVLDMAKAICRRWATSPPEFNGRYRVATSEALRRPHTLPEGAGLRAYHSFRDEG